MKRKFFFIFICIFSFVSFTFGWGIDQVIIDEDTAFPSIDVADNGDLYVACYGSGDEEGNIIVYKSSDGGETWNQWGDPIDSNVKLLWPSLIVAEGISDWIIVGFVSIGDGYSLLRTARRALIDDGDWEFETIDRSDGYITFDMCIDTDDGYYVYAVYNDHYTDEVKFTYSINSAGDWLDIHIQTITLSGNHAQIAYGEDGSQSLVVVWHNEGDGYLYRVFSDDYGSTWLESIIIVDETHDDIGSIDLAGGHEEYDFNGAFVAVYVAESTIYYTKSLSGGNGWNIEEHTLYSDLTNPRNVSLATDDQNKYHLGFLSFHDVCYSYTESWNPGFWEDDYIIVNDDSISNVSSSSDIIWSTDDEVEAMMVWKNYDDELVCDWSENPPVTPYFYDIYIIDELYDDEDCYIEWTFEIDINVPNGQTAQTSIYISDDEGDDWNYGPYTFVGTRTDDNAFIPFNSDSISINVPEEVVFTFVLSNGDDDTTLTLDISEVEEYDIYILPKSNILLPSYPNPFNIETNIRFGVEKYEHVKIWIYDLLGKEVKTIINANYSAGWHNISWNATSQASGIYFIRMKTQTYSETKKIFLMK
ncbi:T9SS type A sorting domain-containing protein [Calditrichota bacterium]